MKFAWQLMILISVCLVGVTACSSDDPVPPTEIRIITETPDQVGDLESTIAAYQTRDATSAEVSETTPNTALTTAPTTVAQQNNAATATVFAPQATATTVSTATATQLASITPLPTSSPRPTATPLPQGFPTPSRFNLTVAEQLFEGGRMLWLQPLREIWVLTGDAPDPTSGTWECYIDTYIDGQPESAPELNPPDGLVPNTDFLGAVPAQPVRGFGRIWRENPLVRQSLGWAIVPETLHSTRYTYNADGELNDDDEFELEPGTIELGSFFQQILILTEDQVNAPCENKGGTWSIE